MIKLDCPKLVKSSILVAIFFLVFFPNAAFALSSNTINFQGKIVRNDTGFEGLNVTTGSPACVVAGNANDTCDFEVKYYSASSGGTLLLTEHYLNSEIGQYNGAFTLSLGSDGSPTAGSYATFDAMIKGVTDLYVQLGFAPGGAGSYTETFSRMPIQASAYALKAKYASGANTAFQFDSAANSSGYTSPVAGMVYYDTTDSALKVYNGSTWGGLGSGGGSLFTDGGIFTYLTALTDHFVLGSSSYTAIGADSYTTYLAGLSTRPSLSFDMTAERLTVSGSQAQSGLTVYSNYTSTGAWPVATFKAEDSGFDNVVMQITQDGTGNILSLQKGSTEAFIFENPLTFYIHPRVDDPLVTANRLYNVNGTLYWNGSAINANSSLWTDAGTFTYLTSTTDDVAIGGSTLGTAAFFFDVSTGNFGIGTSTPGAKLEIAGANSTIVNTIGDITISPDDTLVIKANDTEADNLMEWQNSVGTVLSLINQNGYASFGTNVSNTSAILTLGASTNTVAQINLAAGANVAAPNTGDLWWSGTGLFFYDGSTSVDLLTAGSGGGGSNVISNYGTASDGTYIGVTHGTNSYNVVASGWICVGGSNNAACSGGNWKNIQETDMTITHSLSNQWSDANANGIIRTVINASSVGTTVSTGGTITYTDSNGLNPRSTVPYPNGYTVHRFTSSGTFTSNVAQNVEALVVGGGGGGATGGGGGGGVLTEQTTLNSGANTVTVGNGGTAGCANNPCTPVAGSGGNSIVGSLIAIGGGAGGGVNSQGVDHGGSGGGGGFSSGVVVSGLGMAGQGYSGGINVAGGLYASGGGGGAGSVGQSALSGTVAGSGGFGMASSITGSYTFYGAGGGGGIGSGGTAGFGGMNNPPGGPLGGGGAGSNSGNGTAGTANTGGGGGGGMSYNAFSGGAGGSGVVVIRYKSQSSYPYSIYTSPVVSTPNAQSYDNIKWDSALNTYGKISVQTRSGNTSDPTAPTNSFVWTKYDNTIPTASDTTGTNGRIPLGTSGKGDDVSAQDPSVIKDGDVYKMWYTGESDRYRIYYATSTDGINWTKYDNTVPVDSDTTGTNGKIPLGTSGKGDDAGVLSPEVIKDGSTYKMWYTGFDGSSKRIFYATSPDGLTWTKYDNTVLANSNTTGTSGRIPMGTSGRGDYWGAYAPTVIKDVSTYKMWYSGVDGSGNECVYYATSSDGLTWTKYDNSILAASDTTGTNGRVPLGTSGRGDENYATMPMVLKDGGIYKMWYSGVDRIYYATSSDGLTWTKYDNTIPSDSDTTGTNGRIPFGTNGRGDNSTTLSASVMKDGEVYKAWYLGSNFDIGTDSIYYATGIETIGSWEAWKPSTSGTNYTILQSADTHTTFTGTNATVAEGDVTRNVDYFEDEDEPSATNITKVTSSTNGGYMESTITAANIVNYDYITFWVRASQVGAVLRIGMGESAGTEQYEDITIDTANVWQKVYWDISDIASGSRDAITKIRLTNFSTSSNVIYLDNVKAEKLISTSTGSPVASTPNQYFQYRVIFTTTNLSYQPQLENISFSYNSGYRIVMYDANNTRLYNYTGTSQFMRLNVVASSSSSGGDGFVDGVAVSSIEDGVDAIAFQFNTSTAFTNPSSKLLSVMNNSVEKMYLDADGNLFVSGTITSGKGLGVALVNHSGGIVTERSLVALDTSTNNAFTTTTVPGLQGALGVVQGVEVNGDVDKDGVCDNGDTCLVALEGIVDVNLDNAASSSKGDYIYSSTVAGQGHSASSLTQTNGLLGVVTSLADAGSGFVKMVFDAQNKVTADMYLNISYDENLYRDMYNQLANDYTAMSDAERRGYLESNQSQTIMFDNFVDSLKIDSTNSTIGVDADAKKAGVWGGVTIDNSMLDIAGNRYLGSATATLLTSKYYDRTQSGLQEQDSTPETLVDVGVDPNWYKGVSLQTASNLTTSYNGSLIGVSGVYGTGSEHGYIDLTVTGTTTTGITANIVSSDGTCTANEASLAFGSSYAFVSGSCSGSSITIKPVRSDYKNGDKFRIASWIIEPTTANDRGDKREFPERSVILASSDASYIYVTVIDVDTQRVWMKFSANTSLYVSGNMLLNNPSFMVNSMDILNGQLYVVSNSTSSYNGYEEINFTNDSATAISGGTYKFNGNMGIGGRNIGSGYTLANTTVSILSNEVNDVSAAVIPNQPTQEMTVSGWGWVVGDNSQDVGESVNLPYTFNVTPSINLNLAGRRPTTGGTPATIQDCNDWSFESSVVLPHPTTTNSVFSAWFGSANSSYLYSSSYYYCYTWTATGQVSPKQFVAVATGDTGVDGATTLINKTDQSVTNFNLGSQYANAQWTKKVVLTSKGDLYFARNDDTSGNTLLNVYYKSTTVPSETVIAANRSGYYSVNFAGSWSSGGPTILGNAAGSNQITSLAVTEGTSTTDNKSNTIYVGTALGVSVIQEKQSGGATFGNDGSDEKNGSVKYYTKDYISEQMVGDIRGMWPLNYDNTSADNEDISIKANALTATNITSADAVSGVRGTAVDFNGTDEYLYCTDANCGGTGKLDLGTGNFTFGAWVKTTDTNGIILGKIDTSTGNPGYLFDLAANKARIFTRNSSGTYESVSSNTSINDNLWHYIVATRDSSRIHIFVDGVEEVSTTSALLNIDNAGSVGMGADVMSTPSGFFSGSIDEPTVTATALTSAQIKSQYEDGLRALKGSHTSADTYNQLSGTSNDIRDILVTPDSKYMYVGTEGGGISKIDLTSSTRLNAYTTATDPNTSTNNIETLSGRYYPVFAGDIGSSGALMGIDSNGNNSTGTYYSKTTTFAESTNRAFLWMTASIDPTDTSSSIVVSASNDNGANYVTGTLIQTNTTGSLPEYEYSFVFPTTDNDYKVRFVINRGSSNKATTYISKWGLSQMKMDTATVNGLYTNTNDTIANGSYLEVVHGQNTYNLVANGWVFDTTLNKWIEVTGTDNNVTQNLSNQWSDAAAGGIIRSVINGTNIVGSTVASGGTISYTDSNGSNPRLAVPYPNGYTIHTFTSSGTFTINDASDVDTLVVAGGGGGAGTGGGGGAGGYVYKPSFPVTEGSYGITVGSGGAGMPGGNNGVKGSNSVFSSITAEGGGYGGTHGGYWGGSGGSGGGGGQSSDGSVPAGGSGSQGQGYSGGIGYPSVGWAGGSGGGGGAGGLGAAGSTVAGSGNGGVGLSNSISGNPIWYAGGGGGGEVNGGYVGTGGLGGGGNGGLDAAGTNGTANTGGGGGGGGYQPSYFNGGSGGSGIVIIRYKSQASYPYSIYNSPVVSTPNAQSYDNIRWDSTLNTYGKISVQTRSGATSNPTDGTWESWKPNTSGTNNISLETGDTHTNWVSGPGDVAKFSYVGGATGNYSYWKTFGGSTTLATGDKFEYKLYNTSTVTNYGVDIRFTDGTYARLLGSGWVDQNGIWCGPSSSASEIMHWGTRQCTVPATMNGKTISWIDLVGASNSTVLVYVDDIVVRDSSNNIKGTIYTGGTPTYNVVDFENGSGNVVSATAYNITNTVAEGDVTRNVDYFEDEDETLATNATKLTSSISGGYMESTIASTNLTNYDYVTLWVRASQAGNTLKIGMGESAGNEQYEDITIDAANTWQKVYWDISDIPAANRDSITKLRLTNLSSSSNVIYLDNVQGEKLLSTSSSSLVASTPNQYFQYRVIFTTTNLSYQPQLENISFSYSSGFKIQIMDANTVRLYNNSGKAQKLKLDIVLGSAAIDLMASQYSLNIAPGTAQIDGGNNTNSIWINKMGTGGNLLKLQTNSVDMMVVSSEGDMTLAGDVAIGGGTLSLGNEGAGARYNTTDNTIEFSNDGITWMPLGDIARKVTLSAEYAGAVLSGDGTDNVGSMTSDNTGSSSNSMNYYEWNSSIISLNDYDVRVRFTLPSDFNGWGSTGGIKLNYATESTSNTSNKVDMYIYKEGSATVDGTFAAGVSSSAGVWTSSTIAGTDLNECALAGDTCVFIMRMSSLGDNYVRIGDIAITYNRSL